MKTEAHVKKSPENVKKKKILCEEVFVTSFLIRKIRKKALLDWKFGRVDRHTRQRETFSSYFEDTLSAG